MQIDTYSRLYICLRALNDEIYAYARALWLHAERVAVNAYNMCSVPRGVYVYITNCAKEQLVKGQWEATERGGGREAKEEIIFRGNYIVVKLSEGEGAK